MRFASRGQISGRLGVRAASAAVAMLALASCGGSGATVQVKAADPAPNRLATRLAAPFTFSHGQVLLESPADSDVSAISGTDALAKFDVFQSLTTLSDQPVVFLARLTDTTNVPIGADAPLAAYALKDRLVVVVLAEGPSPPPILPPGAVGPVAPSQSAFLFALDALSGQVITLITTNERQPVPTLK